MTKLLPIVPGCRALTFGKFEVAEVLCICKIPDHEAVAIIELLYGRRPGTLAIRDDARGTLWLLDRPVKCLTTMRPLPATPICPEKYLMLFNVTVDPHQREHADIEEKQDEKETAPVERA